MTIKDTLEGLKLGDWQHVTVRRKAGFNIQYLGGGSVSTVIKRFGDLNIIKSQIIDGVLVIFVE